MWVIAWHGVKKVTKVTWVISGHEADMGGMDEYKMDISGFR